MRKTISKIILAILATAFIYSCGHTTEYPQEFIMADSAFMQGDYQLGDALMEKAQKQIEDSNDEIQLRYYQLLKFEQTYIHNSLSINDYSIADSLCRYYENTHWQVNYAKMLLFMGRIYFDIEDYPKAIDCYLKTKEIAEKEHDSRLQCLIYREIGDLYFKQRMLDECVPYYKKYYQIATANNDIRRKAYAARHMGLVSAIHQNIDSTIYYYREAIELGRKLPQDNDIAATAKYDLCDIYIQLEEYDKALEIMPRDSLNEANWAYWHYGQNHVDSAIYYFQKTLGRYKWQGEVEVLRVLAQLEEQRGNVKAALDYHTRLAEAEDSLKAQQQKEETLRIEAQHNYNSMQQERNQLEQKNKELNLLLWLMGIIVVATSIVAVLLWRARKQRKRAVVMQQHLIEKEKTEQQLLGQLQSAHKEALLLEFKKTALYQRLKAPAKEGTKKMTEAEWHQLANSIDGIYNNFTSRLMNLAKLSETELRICYLLKINMPPSEIADILYKSKGAITLARRRMYRKLTGRNGTAEELDSLIAEL